MPKLKGFMRICFGTQIVIYLSAPYCKEIVNEVLIKFLLIISHTTNHNV
jgi:hypothetical protein